jgi:hypothetical protein
VLANYLGCAQGPTFGKLAGSAMPTPFHFGRSDRAHYATMEDRFSLAVVAAIATPFVFGTWKMRPMSNALVAMTPEEKASVKTYLTETNDCQLLSARVARLGKL